MLEIDLQGEQIQLLPQRAIYWPKERTLIIADLHWGKTGHFRKNGIAIPAQAQHQDGQALSKLIQDHEVDKLIVAGDMFHSRPNREVDTFAHWREQHQQLTIELVHGNHDILPEGTYNNFNITVHEEILELSPFTIAHDELEAHDGYLLHGHIHPAIKLPMKGRTSVRTDCFCIDENRMILPAFGKFTGRYTLNPKNHKHLYIIANSDIIKWK